MTDEEQLGANDLWNCEGCKKAKAAKKRLQLYRLPRVLIIHLKRFHADGSVKNERLVYAPLEELNLSPYLVSQQSQGNSQAHTAGVSHLYDLVAVCNHQGTLYGGHYTATCRLSHTNNWYDFDDQRVTHQVDKSRIVTDRAYLLIYVRRDSPVGPVSNSAAVAPNPAAASTTVRKPVTPPAEELENRESTSDGVLRDNRDSFLSFT